MPVPLNPLSRRAALVGVAAVTASAATGCTTDAGPAAGPGGAARRSGSIVSTTPPGPDVALAARLLAAERDMLARVVAVRRRHPSVAGALSQARATHRAHVRLLRRAVPKPVPRTPEASQAPVRDSIADALAVLADHERGLGALQRSLAIRARSGPFARVVASMAAASAQQVERLTAAAAKARR